MLLDLAQTRGGTNEHSCVDHVGTPWKSKDQ